jgi:hypothetical protein
MSEYSRTKPIPNRNYPSKSVVGGVAGFSRVEAMLTVDRLRQEFLFGIPLVSFITKETLKDETIRNILNRAAARVELECKIDVTPVQREGHFPFDRVKFLQGFNQIDLSNVPLRSLEEFSIRAVNSANTPDNVSGGGPDGKGTVIYTLPLDWIDLSQSHKGILHVFPLISTFTGTGQVAAAVMGPSASLFMNLIHQTYMPAYWYVRWTSGFDENAVPATLNELIGCFAALEILSLIGPLRLWNSQSINIDGSGQSVAGPGSQLFKQRIDELTSRIAELKDLIKARFSQKIVMVHI